MVFSSSIFLLYFLPVFLLVYYLADNKYKNYVALAASLAFFVWGAPLFIFVVLGSVLMNWFLGRMMEKQQDAGKKNLMLAGLIVNILLLIVFQYTGFIKENLNFLAGSAIVGDIPWMKYLVPLGFSFITFHQISYLVDVRRETASPFRRLSDYALFILYFPQLINGPINRVAEMAPQLADRSANDHIDNRLAGFIRFVIGLSKKVLIANVLGAEVDRIFAMPEAQLDTPLAWIAILAYAFQIYFDFSGYSDMAIGLGKMTGFILPENFNSPYTATSMTDFWRRWHMSLSSWLRDYLFMPLSVKMRNAGITGVVISVMITFLICGMWHQPGWTFIVWGAWHGLWLALDQLFLLKVLKKSGRIVATLFTFLITTVGWVFFRAEDFQQAGLFLRRMFSFVYNGVADTGLRADFWTVFALAAVFSVVSAFKPGRKLEMMVFEKRMKLIQLIIMSCIIIILFILCMGSISSSGFIPFIYNRF